MTFELDEGQRRLALCSLAHMALLRPGWDYACGELSQTLGGREMYEHFKRLNADRTPPQRVWPPAQDGGAT